MLFNNMCAYDLIYTHIISHNIYITHASIYICHQHYNMYNGGCETHDTFWNRRKFEILMVPTTKKNQGNYNTVWIEGEVFSFYEYNMGPGGELLSC